MIKYVYEFIGTFFLVLTVGMTVLHPDSVGLWGPVAIGSILAVLVFAGGHVSGGHYNPAVSLAVFMRKKITLKNLWMYWITQLAAGAVAAGVAIYFKGESVVTPIEPDYMKALLAEFLVTFAICYVVLNVGAVKGTAGNPYFGWAIGFTLLVGGYTVGGLTNGAFNPSVALGITVINLSPWANIWIYILANLLGGAAAALIVNAAQPEYEKR